MATHKRTRTGCWTCREAGYKCDEQKPFCARCTRLKIICKGYGVKLKWQDATVSTPAKPPRKSSRRKSTGHVSIASPGSVVSSLSTPLSIRSPENMFPSPESTKSMPLLPAFSPGPSSGLSPIDSFLFQYWIDRLSTLISVAPRTAHFTPFQLHLTSMAYDSAALRSTILSMAANHLGSVSNDSNLRLQAYRHQRTAIRELQQIIQEPGNTNHEPAFATVMMMQVSSRLFGDDDEANVANHLMGAKAMVAWQRKEGWAGSSSARFLMSLFAYHDILSSVSRGARPLVDHATDFTALEGEKDMESIANVLLVVARISELQQTIKRRRMESMDDVSLSEEEDATARVLQQALLNMDFENLIHTGLGNETDVRYTAEAYRHAAFIYLYRTWLDIGAPNPISMDHVQRCLSYLEQVDISSPLTTAHIWPLFTAGCETVGDPQRQFVRTRFGDMYTSKKFPSLKRVMRDIEDVWAAKDMEQQMKGQDGMAKVDCIQVILRRRGREVDLA